MNTRAGENLVLFSGKFTLQVLGRRSPGQQRLRGGQRLVHLCETDVAPAHTRSIYLMVRISAIRYQIICNRF